MFDEYVSLIPAKLPLHRAPEAPEQIRKPLCVVFLRGMVTAFCDTEGDAAWYVGVAERTGGGAVVYAWDEGAGEYRAR